MVIQQYSMNDPNTIGVTLFLENALSDGIDAAKNDLKDFEGVVEDVGKSVDKSFSGIRDAFSEGFGSGLTAVGGQLDIIGSKMSSLGGDLTIGITTPIMGLVGGLGLAAKEASDFEIQMARISTLIDDITDIELKGLGDDIRGLAKDYGLSLDELTQAYFEIIQAGLEGEQAFETLKYAAMASMTELESVPDTARAITVVFGAMGKEVDSVENIMNSFYKAMDVGTMSMADISSNYAKILPLANAFGVELNDVNTAMAVLTHQGYDASTASTILRNMFAELGDSSKDLYERFEQVAGKSFPEFMRGGGDLHGAMTLLRESFEAFPPIVTTFQGVLGDTLTTLQDGSREMELFEQITGKTFQQFILEGNTVSDALKFINKEIKDLGDDASPALLSLRDALEMTGASSNQINEVFKELTGTSLKDFINSGNSIEDAMLAMGDALDKSGVNALDFFSSIQAGQAGLILTSELGLSQIEEFREEIVNSAGAIEESIDIMTQTTSVMMDQINAEFHDMAITLGESVLPIVKDTLLPMVRDTIIPLITGVFLPMLVGVLEIFNKLPEPIKIFVIALTGIAAAIGPILVIVGPLVSAFGGILTAVGGLIAPLAAAGGAASLMGAAFAALSPILIAAAPILAGITIGMLAVLALRDLGVFDWIAEQAGKVFELIKSIDLSALITKIVDTIGEIPSKILGTLTIGGRNIDIKITDIIFPLPKLLQILGVGLLALGRWFGNLGAEILGFMVGTMEPVIDFVTGVISTIATKILELGKTVYDGLGKVFETITGLISAAFTWYIETVKQNIEMILTALTTFAGAVVSAISTLIDTITTAATTFFSAAITAISTLITDIITAVTEFFGDIIERISGTIDTISETVRTWISESLEAIAAFIGNIYERITEFFGDLLESVLETFESMYTYLTDHIEAVVEAVTQFIEDFIEDVTQFKDDVLEIVMDWLTTLYEWITGGITWVTESLFEFVEEIKSLFHEGFEWVYNSVTGWINNMVDQIYGRMTWIRDQISNIVNGIKRSIQDAIGAVTNLGNTQSSSTFYPSGVMKAYETGGYVHKTAPALLHAGEYVLPASVVRNLGIQAGDSVGLSGGKNQVVRVQFNAGAIQVLDQTNQAGLRTANQIFTAVNRAAQGAL